MPDSGGGRNDALTKEAGRLRGRGMDEPEIYNALLNDPARDGLPEGEVRTIARSAMSWPKGEPRPDFSKEKFRNAIDELATRRGWSKDTLKRIGAIAKGGEVHFPMRSASGEITGWRRRRGDNRPFGDGQKCLTVKGGRNGMMMPWPFPADDPILLTEGEMDGCAAIAAGYKAVIATPGSTPGHHVIEALQTSMAGRDFVLTPDPDDAGDGWRDKVGAALVHAGCKVSFIPPGDVDLDKRLKRSSDPAAELQRLIDLAVEIGGESEPEVTKPAGPCFITGPELEVMEIPPTRWAIPSLLPEGEAVLAGRPKGGKSWLALELCRCVAEGALALNHFPTVAGDALYIGAEDNKARLQDRLSKLTNGKPFPARLTLALDFPRLDDGGFKALEDWLTAHPEARLVVLDTLKRLAPPKPRELNDYDFSYALSARLQGIALKFGVAMLCVLHSRKGGKDGDDDFTDGVLGSTGWIAAADAILVLKRQRGTNQAHLFMTGRDVGEGAWKMEMDGVAWTVTGELDAEHEGETPAQDMAIKWIQTVLADGVAIPSVEVFAMAKKAGFGRDLVYKCRTLAGVKVHRGAFQGDYSWSIPSPSVLNPPSFLKTEKDDQEASKPEKGCISRMERKETRDFQEAREGGNGGSGLASLDSWVSGDSTGEVIHREIEL